MKSHASTSKTCKPLVIIAHAARAVAESAHRAGHTVVTVDGFADLDTVAITAESWCLPLINGEFHAQKLLTCLQKLHARFPSARVITGAGAEPFVGEIETIRGWQLLGNSAACVQAVSSPTDFFSALDELSIPYPPVAFQPPVEKFSDWLFKMPLRSGGTGIRRNYRALATPGYWQQELSGVSISALCLCHNGRPQLIGINRQFTCAMSSQLPYLYGGALANYELEEIYIEKLIRYTNELSSYFTLKGLCSFDFLLHAGELLVLEINPRVSATYELYECLRPDTNLIDAHIRVCEGEPPCNLEATDKQCAYAIVYADDHYIVPQLEWPVWSGDRPEPGRELQRLDPVCTARALFGEAEDLYNRARKKGMHLLSLIKQSNTKTN